MQTSNKQFAFPRLPHPPALKGVMFEQKMQVDNRQLAELMVPPQGLPNAGMSLYRISDLLGGGSFEKDTLRYSLRPAAEPKVQKAEEIPTKSLPYLYMRPL